jgi:MscS family membrane protein
MTRTLSFLLCSAVLLTAAAASANDCATPRTATQTFIDNLQSDRHLPQLASSCFDWAEFQGTTKDRQRIAIQLKSVLDANGHYVYYDRIPDEANHVDAETKKAEHTLFPRALPEVTLHKVGDKWLFSPAAVRAVPGYYDATFVVDVHRLVLRLPEPLQSGGIGPLKYWQLLGLLCLFFLSFLLGRLATLLVVGGVTRVLSRRKVDASAIDLSTRTRAPLTLAATCGLMAPVLPLLDLPVQLSATLLIALQVAATASLVLVAYRLIDIALDYFGRKAQKTETRLDDQLVPMVRKALKIALVLVAFIFVLQNLNVDVGSLLAGLGLGGLAFALAAKDSLSHLFGSLTIFIDRPFQLGDWIKIGEVEGTVEEVGFRSTRVRTFYGSLMTVPNSKVADSVVDNMGERAFRRFKLNLGLAYATPTPRIQAFVEGVRAILAANEAIEYDITQVYLNNFGPSSLDVLVYAFLDVPDWSQELEHRHNLLLEFHRLAEALEVEFAFPTQTVHVGTMPGKAASKVADASNTDLAAIVKSFGPGGSQGRPGGDYLTDAFAISGRSERGEADG